MKRENEHASFKRIQKKIKLLTIPVLLLMVLIAFFLKELGLEKIILVEICVLVLWVNGFYSGSEYKEGVIYEVLPYMDKSITDYFDVFANLNCLQVAQ